MADTKVSEIQIWLNSVYKDNENWVTIKEDGITGNNTVAGLIRALQIELGVNVDGAMEPGLYSISRFKTYRWNEKRRYKSII